MQFRGSLFFNCIGYSSQESGRPMILLLDFRSFPRFYENAAVVRVLVSCAAVWGAEHSHTYRASKLAGAWVPPLNRDILLQHDGIWILMNAMADSEGMI